MLSILRGVWLPALLVLLFAAGVFELADDETLKGLGRSYGVSVGALRNALTIGGFLSAAFLVDRLTKAAIWGGLVPRLGGRRAPRLLEQITSFFIYALTIVAVVGFVFIQSVTPLFATSGVVGIVLGFALRSLILDLFAGVAMNVDQPFAVGDWLLVRLRSAPPILGKVQEVHWRTTRLTDEDGNALVVPNSEMALAVVVNQTKPTGSSRFDVSVFLDYQVPVGRAVELLRGALLAACRQKGMLREPSPFVRVHAIEDQKVHYRLFYWIDRTKIPPGRGRDTVLREVLEQLPWAGLEPALARQDLFLGRQAARGLDVERAADRLALLRRVDLFGSLDDDDLDLLNQRAVARAFEQGAGLICQGEPGQSMYVLLEGALAVRVRRPRGEDDVEVAQLWPGQAFGEMSLLTGEPRSATIVALTDARCLEIDREAMLAVLQRQPELALRISRKMARRQTRNDARLAELSDVERDEKAHTLAAEIFGRMRRFFGLGGD